MLEIPELLTSIFSHLSRHDLAAACLVCRTFWRSAIALLLEDISPFGMAPLYKAFPEDSVEWVVAHNVLPHVSRLFPFFSPRNRIDGRFIPLHTVQRMGEEISETYQA